MEKLELLDDLVYESISGNTTALAQLQFVWPQMQTELGEKLLAESSEQYLRYALSIWEDCSDKDSLRNPTLAVQALDVLCLLFVDC
jgi:lauroyl/myristoyl acyltransferase